MRSLLAGVGVAASAALCLVACSNAEGDLDAEDSPFARYNWDQRSGMEALLVGELVLQDGCMYVSESPEHRPGSVAAFPREFATWEADEQVLDYSGKAFREGDRISAGGGWTSPTEDVDIPQACDLGEYGEVFLIQDSDIAPSVG